MTDTFKEEKPSKIIEDLLTQIAQEVRQEPTINGTLLKLNVLSILSRYGAKVGDERV